MTRGFAIVGAVLCCLPGCISKVEPRSSNSTAGSANSSSDSSTQEISQVEPADPEVARATQEPVERALPEDAPETEVISFDDLNLGLAADVRFRRFMLADKRAAELIDKRINIAGYISPTDRMTRITDFILLRNLECKFGPGGKADHLVHVLMQEDASADFTDKVVYVEGTLKLNPFHSPDGSATWSIYDLHGVSISTTPPSRLR